MSKIKHVWDSSYRSHFINCHEFMNFKREDLVGQFGGSWTWYTAHQKNILLPYIDFKYLEIWDEEKRGKEINEVRDVISNYPQTLLNIFHQCDLSIPEITYACAWLIKNEDGFMFGICRTGQAVQIYKI